MVGTLFQLVVSLRRRQLRARRSPRPVAQGARRRDAGLPGEAVHAKTHGDFRSEGAAGESLQNNSCEMQMA